MLKNINPSLPPALENELEIAIADWNEAKRTSRIWQKDASVWTNSGEEKWLGWLDIANRELADIEKFRAFHKDVLSAEFKDIVLMGMGGSSLCPEVLAITFSKPNFHILDSTVPEQI